MSSSSTSPNTSDSSFELKESVEAAVRLNIPCRHENGVFSTYNLQNSSPTSVHNHAILPLPMIEHAALNNNNNMFGSNLSYFNPSSSCINMAQIGLGSDGFFGSENIGVLSSANIGSESDIFVPPLESISSTDQESYKIYDDNDHDQMIRNSNNNYMIMNNINTILNCNTKTKLAHHDQNQLSHGVENSYNFQAHDQLTVGDWDLEDLMKDVSSFPFLDFQIE